MKKYKYGGITYVLQLGFDYKSQEKIMEIKKYLKENKVKNTERDWLPHITIDLYDTKNKNKFIDIIN